MEAEFLNMIIGAGGGAAALHLIKEVHKAYVGKVIDKNATALSDLPELFIHFEYVKQTMTKIEVQLELLASQKEENTRRLILLEAQNKSAHYRLDQLHFRDPFTQT